MARNKQIDSRSKRSTADQMMDVLNRRKADMSAVKCVISQSDGNYEAEV